MSENALSVMHDQKHDCLASPILQLALMTMSFADAARIPEGVNTLAIAIWDWLAGPRYLGARVAVQMPARVSSLSIWREDVT